MRWTNYVWVLALVATLSPIIPGQSNKQSFSAGLDGNQVIPPILSEASGRSRLKVTSEEPPTIDFELSYAHLTGTGVVTAAHVHFGQPGLGGGVIFDLCGGSAPVCPNGEGTVNGIVVANEIKGPTNQGVSPGDMEAALSALRTGEAFVMVHTTAFPQGEIAGRFKAGAVGPRGKSQGGRGGDGAPGGGPKEKVFYCHHSPDPDEGELEWVVIEVSANSQGHAKHADDCTLEAGVVGEACSCPG